MAVSEMAGDEYERNGSDDRSASESDAARAALAAAFETDRDPLATYAATFTALAGDSDSGDNRVETGDWMSERLRPTDSDDTADTDGGVDPFALFITEVLDRRDPAASTRRGYRRAIDQWCTYMKMVDRHPACPNAAHVRGFATHRQRVHGNQPRTVMTKLHRLQRIFRYWQDDPAFPHSKAFDPFALALPGLNLEQSSRPDFPWLSLETLRARVAAITHVRARALVVLQLKLGLRATEVCNLRVGDLNLTDPECQRWYPNLASHSSVADRPDAVYIATKFDRPGNKSARPRVLPVDDELQRVLRDWLLVRPQNGTPWLFLTQHTQTQLDAASVNRAWTDAFHPQFAGSETRRAITSHYGRHRFTTFWRVNQELSRELVQYMRGDILGEWTPADSDGSQRGLAAIDDYLHAYYEDIATVYRERMYKLEM